MDAVTFQKLIVSEVDPDSATLVLITTINNSAVTVRVASPDGVFPPTPFKLFIDSEILGVTADPVAVASSINYDLTVVRAQNSTIAAGHTAGADVLTGGAATVSNMLNYWIRHTDKYTNYFSLQYLYTKRDVILMLLGKGWRKDVDWEQARTKQANSQRSKNLEAMLEAVNSEILKIETLSQNAVGVLSGVITKVAPIDANPPTPDPHDIVYTGDPQKRSPTNNDSRII